VETERGRKGRRQRYKWCRSQQRWTVTKTWGGGRSPAPSRTKQGWCGGHCAPSSLFFGESGADGKATEPGQKSPPAKTNQAAVPARWAAQHPCLKVPRHLHTVRASRRIRKPKPPALRSDRTPMPAVMLGDNQGKVRLIAQFIDDRKRGENTGHPSTCPAKPASAIPIPTPRAPITEQGARVGGAMI
jgi:hypothetical protein